MRLDGSWRPVPTTIPVVIPAVVRTMGSNNDVVRGQNLSQEEKAEFDSLRSIFDPKSAIDRLDSYGKWLFASAAIVGSLGAGLSNSAISKLHGWGVWLYAFAIVALGFCLVAASRSVAPHWIEARLADLSSLREAVNSQFEGRRRQLAWAAVSFAVALVLAAFSPLVSLLTAPGIPAMHFSVDEKGALNATLEAHGVEAGTALELRLDTPSGPGVQLPRCVATADESGDVKLELGMAAFSASTTAVDLVSYIKNRSQSAFVEQQRLRVHP
jgi:hypothetical protein